MFIAFEGPDNAGKSTAATHLATDGVGVYNATKELHRALQEAINPEPDLVITYDRIDWLTHMVYRLALPGREWNDDRVRTVFAMPDTHLVFKLHSHATEDFTADEVVDTPIKNVNKTYRYVSDLFGALNRSTAQLFKSITVMEVVQGDEYRQRIIWHESPIMNYWCDASYASDPLERAVSTNDDLLEFLREQDRKL